MKPAHSQFLANLRRARDLRALFIALKATTAGTLDLSEILRRHRIWGECFRFVHP